MSDNGQSNPLSPIVPGRSGRPGFSLDALRERIEKEFQEETARRADILLELDTDAKRRAMLREVADYVLALEHIALPVRDKTTLLDQVYRNLFSFGPLDDYLQDDQVTEITINGPHNIHVRRGPGKLEVVSAAFDDRAHLEGILERVLATGGTSLSENEPFIETGVVLAGRAARISLIGPPIQPDYSLEIRLHPRRSISLNRLQAVPPQAVTLLGAILTGKYGLLVVGDVGLGKTTLANALVHVLPDDQSIIVVERAAEMHLPPTISRRTPLPPTADDPGSDFVAQIRAALDERPGWLVIDEIRSDEPIWDALTLPDAPHYLWVFRGDSQPDRLRSAFSMVIRRQHPTVEQEAIYEALSQHLPFVAAFKMINGIPRLHLIAEWQRDGADLTLCPLLSEQNGGWLVVDDCATRALNLPDDFWR